MSNREYRNMPMLAERRDESAENEFIVEGYASTFDEYELFKDETGTSYCERIEPDAFKECDMTDVVFLLDHTGRVYARTRNGSVGLKTDEHGLYTKVDLSRSSSGRAVKEDIDCGNYDRMSFAFTVADDSFEHDRDANKYLRVIKRVGKLFDISAVSFPANPNTEIAPATRSAFDGFLEEEKRLEVAEMERKAKLEAMREEIRRKLNGGNAE